MENLALIGAAISGVGVVVYVRSLAVRLDALERDCVSKQGCVRTHEVISEKLDKLTDCTARMETKIEWLLNGKKPS